MAAVTCAECREIAEEILRSHCDLWISGDQAFRDAWLARNRLVGGTEEDVLRAEELFPKARTNPSPAVGRAVMRKLADEALTGHKVPIPPLTFDPV